MIRVSTVRQIGLTPVSDELYNYAKAIQETGGEIISITETKVIKTPDHTDQAFVIVWDDGTKNNKGRQMILAHLVEKTVSYKPVAHELKDMLRIIQCDWGCKVLNVIETKGYGEPDQAFIILYEDSLDEEEEVSECSEEKQV